MDKSPLKVQQLIDLLLAMNPRADVFWYDAKVNTDLCWMGMLRKYTYRKRQRRLKLILVAEQSLGE
ncbi:MULTISPECIES: hypothetical protein [Paenibacillus]|uniref:hypothetical protein n=1 Tax=Paenibacillus TaxID=44249 RepID=UPI00096E1518|nr:hypothetical protein [Paenibacillus odorifer]OME17516.1 hypothetical protein BSK57_26205 [Paenibacillus odorifer]